MPAAKSPLSRFSSAEITRMFKVAKRVIKHPSFDILISPATQQVGRLLVVTSAKVGNAPTRNKIRRRCKEIFRKDQLFLQPYDCIMIAKKDAPRCSYQEIQTLISSAYHKAAGAVDAHRPA